ncbi:CBS domain-containing protein [Desulfovibrio ferrophilus]|uniref:Polynucleotide adenylyltransferase region n=1 Tax=Desulfovibrio ferrophilus TaxID=241368 RepID=A0A2Z6AWR0_9BACT|nr:CBS domain-containing protein [Desulfovibrio ferrophilus]BBD07684.1 Polynucleotide adenylyltransferase region [Desulfovibrio ferrophilus]
MNKPEKIDAPLIITSHANADFDSLAAMVAASRLYPGAVLVFPGSQEKNLRNFYIQSAMYMFNFRNVREIDLSTVRTLVLVDTRQQGRVPHVKQAFDNPNLEIHTYDHHPDNDDDVVHSKGKVIDWGSTATILTHEIMGMGITLKPDEATIIGLGIFEDTGSFTFNSTKPEDFQAAAWLLTQGMDTTVISDLITRDLSAEQVSLLNALLESAKTHDIRGVPVVTAEISTEEYVSDFALLAHKIIDMENIRVLFALGRMHDRVHLVARSRSPEVDVGQICASFGGGGHAAAASASIKDRTMSQVKDELFALLNTLIRPQHGVQDLMSRPAIVIEREMTTAEAAEIMSRYGLKAAPIVDMETGKFIGVLEHQIADKAVGHGLSETPATDYMMRASASVSPDTNLYEIIEIVLGQGQRLVPVIDKGHIVGVVTRTDLINLLVDEPARIPESLMPERSRERNIRILLNERLPKELVGILHEAGELADELEQSIYAVGGFVRDILMDTPNLDLDLVVEGDGIAFAQALGDKLGGRVRAHRKFQTAVIVLPDGQHIDVATARLEYYEYPAALPTVELSSIKMDLYRRDFTINALAVQLNKSQFGRLVDFFGAQRDIKNRVIRVLHSLSFVEDPTRILRAIRFAQRYSFQIGGQTERLIKNALGLGMMEKLSGSRLFNEMCLIFEEKTALACLRQMRDLRLLSAIHPMLTLSPAQEELLEEIEKVLEWYRLLYLNHAPRSWIIYFMALANGAKDEETQSLAERFNLTPKQINDFLALRKQLNQSIYHYKMWKHRKGPLSQLCFQLDELPVEGVLFFMSKFKQEATRRDLSQYLTRLKDAELDISGRDLQLAGLPEGPAYGEILKKVRAAMLDGNASCREDQLNLVRKIIKDPAYIGLEPHPRTKKDSNSR